MNERKKERKKIPGIAGISLTPISHDGSDKTFIRTPLLFNPVPLANVHKVMVPSRRKPELGTRIRKVSLLSWRSGRLSCWSFGSGLFCLPSSGRQCTAADPSGQPGLEEMQRWSVVGGRCYNSRIVTAGKYVQCRALQGACLQLRGACLQL